MVVELGNKLLKESLLRLKSSRELQLQFIRLFFFSSLIPHKLLISKRQINFRLFGDFRNLKRRKRGNVETLRNS